MNTDSIKAKLEKFTPKPKQSEKKEKIDYTKIYWKPKAGKYIVRIVPNKFTKGDPFQEIYFHYGINKFPMLALTNWGEKDPIVDFASELKKNFMEHKELIKKLTPKMRIFVPVIVRGEEDKGVRLWEFGKEIYMQLLNFANDEDYNNYDDIAEGRDLTLEFIDDKMANKNVVKCSSVRIKPKTSNLSEDAEQVKIWLENQPDILSINIKYSYDGMKNILAKWLNPEEEVSNEFGEDDSTVETETPVIAETVIPTKTKKSKAFEELFKPDEE